MNVTNLPNDFWKIVNLMIFDGNKILLWKIAHLPTIDISRNPSQQKSPAGFVEITIGKNWSKMTTQHTLLQITGYLQSDCR